MADRDGIRQPETAEKSLGEIVGEVSEKAALLVREEIELAKVEVQEKAKSLGKAAAVGAAAGVFLFFMAIFLFHTLAWGLAALLDRVWLGYLITTVVLLVLAALAGFLAYRFVQRGTPPKPDLAIEEAKRTRQAIEEVRG